MAGVDDSVRWSWSRCDLFRYPEGIRYSFAQKIYNKNEMVWNLWKSVGVVKRILERSKTAVVCPLSIHGSYSEELTVTSSVPQGIQ